jgi:hypothetical protein
MTEWKLTVRKQKSPWWLTYGFEISPPDFTWVVVFLCNSFINSQVDPVISWWYIFLSYIIPLLIARLIQWYPDGIFSFPNHETLILIALDTEKAFDVVDHIHLFWKIYHQDITGSTWLLIKELYCCTSWTTHITSSYIKSHITSF